MVDCWDYDSDDYIDDYDGTGDESSFNGEEGTHTVDFV
jgi:hypothetical protein